MGRYSGSMFDPFVTRATSGLRGSGGRFASLQVGRFPIASLRLLGKTPEGPSSGPAHISVLSHPDCDRRLRHLTGSADRPVVWGALAGSSPRGHTAGGELHPALRTFCRPGWGDRAGDRPGRRRMQEGRVLCPPCRLGTPLIRPSATFSHGGEKAIEPLTPGGAGAAELQDGGGDDAERDDADDDGGERVDFWAYAQADL
jgi:hypothetical protein